MFSADFLFEKNYWDLPWRKIRNWFITNWRSQKNCLGSNIILTVWINISFKRFSLQLESRDKLELTTVSRIWYFLPIFTNRYRNSSDHNLINISSGVQSYLGNTKLIETHLIIAVCDCREVISMIEQTVCNQFKILTSCIYVKLSKIWQFVPKISEIFWFRTNFYNIKVQLGTISYLQV